MVSYKDYDQSQIEKKIQNESSKNVLKVELGSICIHVDEMWN